MDTMSTRERFHAVMNFQPFDRLPIVEWAGWWDKTVQRWHGEGMPVDPGDRYGICRHFGLDVYKQDWFRPRGDGCPKPAHHGAGLIRNADDYERIRPHLYPWPAVDKGRWRAWAEEQKRGEVALWFTVEGFFWFPRTLFGIEPHLYAFYDEPELMHRINQDMTDFILRVVDDLCTVCVPDFMTFAEDMSYNHGPMLSQELFDTFMRPYYEQVVPRLKEQGIIPIVDSDGDITACAPWFESVGVEGMLPLERQAGVDVGVLRARHPRMRFIGCYDKMVMNQGEAAVRGEFERLLTTASRGGLIIGCDHQTPPGVSLAQYQAYIGLFRDYAAEAGRQTRKGTA